MITRQTVISALVKLKDAGIDVSEQFESLKNNQGITKELVEFLRTHSPQFMFYKDLQKHQKTLIKNILDYDSFDAVGKMKLCSSLITRAMISVEYKNLDKSLLDELELNRISDALHKALNDRDYSKLDTVLEEQKQSIKLFVKDIDNED